MGTLRPFQILHPAQRRRQPEPHTRISAQEELQEGGEEKSPERRIREAYRTQKDLARSGGNDILFFYTASSIEEYGVIRNDIANILGQI